MPYSLSRHLKNGCRDKLLILAIMFCCIFIRRAIFPQLINNYKLFYVNGYWNPQLDGWAAIGKNLADGNGYRNKAGEITAARGPIFPFYLALIFRLFGYKKGLSIAVSMQMVLDMLSCWLIWKLAWKLFNCRYTAALAACMWAIYPPAIALDIFLFSEPLFTLILGCFSLKMLSLMQHISWQRFCLAGVILGVATLCRPITLYFPFILLPTLMWLYRRRFSEIWRYSLVFLAGFALVLAPWVVRNQQQFKKFVPASTLLGYNWYYSLLRMEKDNYLKTYEFYDWDEIHQLTQQKFSTQGIDFQIKNEAEKDQLLRLEAWKMIKKYPYRYLLICVNRLGLIWLNLDIRGYLRLRNLIIFAIQLPIILLSLAAFIFFRGRWTLSFFPILLLIVYNSLSYAMVLGTWRFNIPIMPYMLILSAYSLTKIAAHLKAPGSINYKACD